MKPRDKIDVVTRQVLGPHADDVRIIFAEPSEDALSNGLRLLTKALHVTGKADGSAGGFFGGEYGYGADFENDIFLMHRDCGCECEGECPWCTGCRIYQERNACRTCATPGLSLAQRRAAPLAERCDYVAGRGIFARFAPFVLDHERHYYDPPNFWHKATNLRVTWYKYIGRSMRVCGTLADWPAALRDALASFGVDPATAATLVDSEEPE